jgi:hypothetical protein
MGKHDTAIQRLRETIADALESLTDLAEGKRRFRNGVDETPWWVMKYVDIIVSSAALIRGYAKHNG